MVCLTFRLPNFSGTFTFEFPSRRLPSCNKCKKNYKTREFCREIKKHSELPWTSVYMCLIFDPSCFDENNKLRNNDDVFHCKELPWQPYKFKEDFEIDKKMPMCNECKSKNYTRNACRGKKYNHRTLPWTTAFGSIYCPNPNMSHAPPGAHVSQAAPEAIPAPDAARTGNVQESSNGENSKRKELDEALEEPNQNESNKRLKVDGTSDPVVMPQLEPQAHVEEVDLNIEADKSRALFVEISSKVCNIQVSYS